MTYQEARNALHDAAREFTNRWEHAAIKEPRRPGEVWDEAELLEKMALDFARAHQQALGEDDEQGSLLL